MADEMKEIKQEMEEYAAESEVSGLRTVQQPFSCSVCGRTYTRLKMLDKHQLKHIATSQVNGTTGGTEAVESTKLNSESSGACDGAVSKRYVCGECGDDFDKESQVKSHMLKHMCFSTEQTDDGLQVFKINKLDIRPLSTATESLQASNDESDIEQTSSVFDREDAKSAPDTNNVTKGSGLKKKQRLKNAKKVTPRLLTNKAISGTVGVSQRKLRKPAQRELCTICGKVYRSLNVHMKLHRRGTYECPDCGRRFPRSDYLKEHRRLHSGERPFLCIKCGASFRCSGSYRAHLLTHSDERQYHCEQCGKWFRRSSNRNEHIRNVHEGVRAYSCPVCERTFTTSGRLKCHMMEHTNERPHACSVCPKRFKTRKEVDFHFVTHTGEHKFPCKVCGCRFTHPSAVRMHERTQHTEDGGRRFECELCGHRFSKRLVRDAHMRRHKGEKPYTCTVCHKTFACVSDLRSHVVKKHKMKCNSAAGQPLRSSELDVPVPEQDN